MNWFFEVLWAAIRQIFVFDQAMFAIVALTLGVTMSALCLAVILGFPLAVWLALSRRKTSQWLMLVIQTLMSFPPILAGLLVYLLLSRQGPLGFLDLLFTPTAMVLAQFILIFPIVCGLSQQVFYEKNQLFSDLFYTLRLSRRSILLTLIYESRYQLLGAVATGLGRGLAEVGAVMIAGGNILHYTRTLTTSIALQTSQGEIVRAVSLGLILLGLAFLLNGIMIWFRHRAV